MYYTKIQKKGGYVVLFSMIISAIVLSVIIGLSNIAFRQRVFTKESQQSSMSIANADLALECANAYDMSGLFEVDPSGSPINTPYANCVDNSVINPTYSTNPNNSVTFDSQFFETPRKGCARFTITKNIPDVNQSGDPVYRTEVTGKGYNISCADTQTELNNLVRSQTLVERQLGYSYILGN